MKNVAAAVKAVSMYAKNVMIYCIKGMQYSSKWQINPQ